MLFDPRLPAPNTKEEAAFRFAEIWAAAEAAIASRKEIEAFREKWGKLSEGAQATINRAVQAEWGDDLEMGEMLSRATFGWDGYQNDELRAEALRPLIAWWEAQGGVAKAWRTDTKVSDFTVFVERIMGDHKASKPYARASKVETLMRHLGLVSQRESLPN
jgi:hypothetical protein